MARAAHRLQIGHVRPVSKRYRAATCHRCNKNPVVYRKHFCAECDRDSPHQKKTAGRPVERRCVACGERRQIDDFRAIMVDFRRHSRIRHVDRCFRCEAASDAIYETLSPYHRATIEVERVSGFSCKDWIYGSNDWNDLHYERMVFHANLRLPHGWQPLSALYDLPMPALVLYVDPQADLNEPEEPDA